jgi:hypothetical protein
VRSVVYVRPAEPEAGRPHDPGQGVEIGGAGPVGGSRSREYEGPASQAPEWAKPKTGGK